MMQDELELTPDVTTITSVIDAHAKARDKDGAVKYFEIMTKDLYLKPDLLTMNAIIRAHSKLGDKDGAVKYYNMMRNRKLGIQNERDKIV